MSIETADEYNTRLGYCGCCAIPLCPTPEIQRERKTGNASTFGFLPFVQPAGDLNDDLPLVYETKEKVRTDEYWGEVRAKSITQPSLGSSIEQLRIDTFSGGDSNEPTTKTATVNRYDGDTEECTSESNTPFFSIGVAGLVDVTKPAPECELSRWKYWWEAKDWKTGGNPPELDGCPGPFTPIGLSITWADLERRETVEITLGDGKSKLQLVNDAISVADEKVWAVSSSWSSTSHNWPSIGDFTPWRECHRPDSTDPTLDSTGSINASVSKIRFRFKIPISHKGSYFKVTYDIAEFPVGSDLDPTHPDYVAPSFVSQDNTQEWTGPGTGDEDDPSWLLPWIEIEPPAVPGERRVVNIRYTCYSGTKYGVKPQVTGEALELPAP